MPIRRPSRVLLRNLPLPFVSNRVGGPAAKPVDATLPLVPIIDLMICMVVFLLMSFGASGELVAQKASIKMPSATQGAELERAPTVAIDPVVITLDDHRVADTATLTADPRLERIEELVQRLETMKRNWAVLHTHGDFPGELTLQADVSIDYRVIKKVMFSAQQAGYPNIRFAVNRATAR